MYVCNCVHRYITICAYCYCIYTQLYVNFHCSTEFSHIQRTYFLLYQSLIPNCKLTISILREHFEITSDIEQYILDGRNARLCNQRLLNILLVWLHNSKDYMQFCKFLQLTSVLTNLDTKMISGIVYIFIVAT